MDPDLHPESFARCARYSDVRVRVFRDATSRHVNRLFADRPPPTRRAIHERVRRMRRAITCNQSPAGKPWRRGYSDEASDTSTHASCCGACTRGYPVAIGEVGRRGCPTDAPRRLCPCNERLVCRPTGRPFPGALLLMPVRGCAEYTKLCMERPLLCSCTQTLSCTGTHRLSIPES